MKRIVKLTPFVFFSLLYVHSFAQPGKKSIGGYGAVHSGISWMNNKPVVAIGAYGGVLINHKLLLGGTGNTVFFNHQVNGKSEKFQFNYYGLYTEYRLKPWHSFQLAAGMTGALGWQENQVFTATKTRKRDGDFTFVFEPKLAVYRKVNKFMQVHLQGSYRFTGSTHSVHFPRSHYNGPALGAGLVFGLF